MRLIMTNLMNHKSLNSNHWLSKRRDICACDNCLPNKIAILFNTNNFSFINPKDIKILRLDATYYDESSEPQIIKFQSLVVETS